MLCIWNLTIKDLVLWIGLNFGIGIGTIHVNLYILLNYVMSVEISHKIFRNAVEKNMNAEDRIKEQMAANQMLSK